MDKTFVYNVSVVIQNRLSGATTTLTQGYNGIVELNDNTYFGEFKLEDNEPYLYVKDKVDEYCSNKGLSLEDIDIIRFEVVSQDTDVVTYFASTLEDRIVVNKPIYAWIERLPNYLEAPILVGNPLNTDRIEWQWNIIPGCAYEISDDENNIIATVGEGISRWFERLLQSDTNYTRSIVAYNADLYSQKSDYVTVRTPAIGTSSVKVFEQKKHIDVDLRPLPVDLPKSNLFKSGIGSGDDLLVNIEQSEQEKFSCTAAIVGDDVEDSKYYPEVIFQARQKTVSQISRNSRFGRLGYEIYKHFNEPYSCKLNAEAYHTININRDSTVELLAEATGAAIVESKFRYKIDASIKNQPVDIRRDFTFDIASSYDTSYDLRYKVKGTVEFGDKTPKTNNVQINLSIPVKKSWNNPVSETSKTFRVRAIAWVKQIGRQDYDIATFKDTQVILTLNDEQLLRSYNGKLNSTVFDLRLGPDSSWYEASKDKNRTYAELQVYDGGRRIYAEDGLSLTPVNTSYSQPNPPTTTTKSISWSKDNTSDMGKISEVLTNINSDANTTGYKYNVTSIQNIPGQGPRVWINGMEIDLTGWYYYTPGGANGYWCGTRDTIAATLGKPWCLATTAASIGVNIVQVYENGINKIKINGNEIDRNGLISVGAINTYDGSRSFGARWYGDGETIYRILEPYLTTTTGGVSGLVGWTINSFYMKGTWNNDAQKGNIIGERSGGTVGSQNDVVSMSFNKTLSNSNIIPGGSKVTVCSNADIEYACRNYSAINWSLWYPGGLYSFIKSIVIDGNTITSFSGKNIPSGNTRSFQVWAYVNNLLYILELFFIDGQINNVYLYKTEAEYDSNFISASLESQEYSFNGLTAMNPPKFDINPKKVSQILKELADANPQFVGKTYTIKNNRIELTSNNPNDVQVMIWNGPGYPENIDKICAKALKPNHFYKEYQVTGTINTTQVGDLIIKSAASLSEFKPVAIVDGVTYYPDSDYTKWAYTIKNISTPFVSIKWQAGTDSNRVGPDNLIANTPPFYVTFSATIERSGSVITTLDQDINSKEFDDALESIVLKCEPDNKTGVMENTIYTGSLDDVIFTLTKLSGNAQVSWVNSNTDASNKDDSVVVSVSKFVTKYSKTIKFPKTVGSEAGDNVLLISIDDVVKVKPYYDSQEWPFETDKIKYTILKDQPFSKIMFENGTNVSLGGNNIYCNVTSNNVHFTKTVSYSGPLYDYECPKNIIGIYSIIPFNTEYGKYPGDMINVTYTITDMTNRNVAYYISPNKDFMLDIINPKVDLLLDSKVIWIRTTPTRLSYGESNPNKDMYELRKISGDGNTVVRVTGNSEILKEIGENLYTVDGIFSCYALQGYITLDDIYFDPWKIYAINSNGKEDITIPIDNQSVQNTVGEVSYELEIDQAANHVITYTIEGSNFVLSCDYTESIPLSVIMTDENSVNSTSDIFTITKREVKEFEMTIANPFNIMGEKKFVLRLTSENPNILLTSDVNIQDLCVAGSGETITIPIRASILIQSQTPWNPIINHGYYYLSTKEHYLFGKNDIIQSEIGIDKYKTLPIPVEGSPITVIDDTGIVYKEIPEGIEMNEDLNVVNSRYVYTKYTGVDPDSIYINGDKYTTLDVYNNIITLPNNVDDDIMNIRYKVINSFHVDEKEGYLEVIVNGAGNHKVYYETGDKFKAEKINLNPLRSQMHNGFLYIKE